MLLRKTDKYVLKSFAAWYAVCLFALMGLYIIVDLFMRLHKFFRFPGPEIPLRILWFYLWNTPFNFLEFLPMVTLMAGMFTVAMIAKNNELVPMMASGISLYRVTSLILVCSVIVMFAMFAMQEWYVPTFADIIAEASDKPRNKARGMQELKIDGSRHNIVHYRSFDPVEEAMLDVTIQQWETDPTKEIYSETRRIFAEKATIGDAQILTTNDGKRFYGFEHSLSDNEILMKIDDIYRLINKDDIESYEPVTLKNGSVIEGSEINLESSDVLFRNGAVAMVISRDRRKSIENTKTWILQKGTNLDYVRMARDDRPPWQFPFNHYSMAFPTDLKVRDLKFRRTEPRFKTFGALMELIERYPAYDSWKVELYRRITLPLTNLILLLVGLPFVMRADKKSVFVSLGICILIFLCFFVLSFICHDLGEHKHMPPALAVALPLIVFTTIGVYKFDAMRT